MKRLFGFAIIIFVLYIIYYDTSIGTLPTVSGQETQEIVKADSTDEVVEEDDGAFKEDDTNPFQELEVSAGDTVLSIVEEISPITHTLSISDIIVDFEELNPGEKANSLQIGKRYKFPLYE